MEARLNTKERESGYRRLMLAATVGAIVLGLLAVGERASGERPERSGDAPLRNVASLSASAGAAGAPQNAENAKFVVERVTVFPYGLEPEEITRPTGSFLLAIDNRAGTEDLSFRLETDQRQLVQNDAIRSGRTRTAREMRLAPGTYVLTEDSHPEWRCTITVTGK